MTDTPEVPVDVTTRHGHVTDSQRDYAVRKAAKLPRYYNRVSRIEVVVQEGLHEHPQIEMIVHCDGHEAVVAKEHRDHFVQAIDSLVDKLERQLTKLKEKTRDHRSQSLGEASVREGARPPADEV
jgi:putative sigma-54 modulation protein